ncbi:MAG TPA: hypothetical protein PKE30_16785 [Niabella sp.]|nr:hypothetical protein [Niabella sp.]
MNSFKDFGITTDNTGFVGDKIKIERVLNKKIIVEDYKVEDSKYGPGKCLYLQIVLDGSKRVVFKGSKNLIAMIEQVPKNKFPFETIIIDEDGRLIFT